MARAARHHAAVRAGTNADVLAVAPVEQIVATRLAGGGMVGDLVGRQSCLLRQVLGQHVEIVRELAVGHAQPAAGMEIGERRAGLDGELVERQVSARQPQGLRQLALPRLQALAGPGIDQVEGEAREGAA
jgi:hypothetical protein